MGRLVLEFPLKRNKENAYSLKKKSGQMAKNEAKVFDKFLAT